MNKKDNPLAIVHAKKGDLEREFPQTVWDHMGATKQGWEEIKKTPKELTGGNDAKNQSTKSDVIVINGDNVFGYMKLVAKYLLSPDNKDEIERIKGLIENDEELKSLVEAFEDDFDLGDEDENQNTDDKGGKSEEQSNKNSEDKKAESNEGATVKKLTVAQQNKANIKAAQEKAAGKTADDKGGKSEEQIAAELAEGKGGAE